MPLQTGCRLYYTQRPARPRRPPPRTPPTVGQMVWVPPQYLTFGTGSGHLDRPSYSVTPGGRGMVFVVLPCTSNPLGALQRFYELTEIHYKTRGDRPWSVYSHTWAFDRAERVNFSVTGPLDRYVTLTSSEIQKPYLWWQERGSQILDEPPKPSRA